MWKDDGERLPMSGVTVRSDTTVAFCGMASRYDGATLRKFPSSFNSLYFARSTVRSSLIAAA